MELPDITYSLFSEVVQTSLIATTINEVALSAINGGIIRLNPKINVSCLPRSPNVLNRKENNSTPVNYVFKCKDKCKCV